MTWNHRNWLHETWKQEARRRINALEHAITDLNGRYSELENRFNVTHPLPPRPPVTEDEEREQ